MKTPHHILTLAAILATAVLATEPTSRTDSAPEHDTEARQRVQLEIAARLQSSHRPFSRARAPLPQSHFQQWVVVDGEKRLPFEVTETGFRGKKTHIVTGYVRHKDQVIFILDPKTKLYIRADRDPRFAPQNKKPSPHIPG